MRQGFTLLEFVLLMFVLALVVGFAVTNIMQERRATRKANCSSNLRSIGLALEQYSAESYYASMPSKGTATTKSIEVARMLCLNGSGLVGDPVVFLCPGKGRPASTATLQRTDYIFFGNLNKAVGANSVIAADRPGNHSHGANLLYKDVHVKFEPCPNGDVTIYAKWAKAFEAGDMQAAALGPTGWARQKKLIQ